MEAYLGRFFPPSLTYERRREIIMFQQGEDESLYIAWERFKRLLKRCPMHGIDLKTQMDIVYHALNDTSKGIIDASCCGEFKRKSAEEARDLIEDLAKCNMKAPSESSRGNNRGKGVMELSKMTTMEAKLDAIMHRMDKQEIKMHSAHEIGVVEREEMRRSAEVPIEEDSYGVEEAKSMNEPRSYNLKPNPNLSPHITVQQSGIMRIFHMVEGQHKAQGMDIIHNRDINSHQGSNNSIKGVKAGITIKVRGGPSPLKNKCCSSWGITRGCYTSMNRNCLTWKLSSLILKCFRRIQVPH